MYLGTSFDVHIMQRSLLILEFELPKDQKFEVEIKHYGGSYKVLARSDDLNQNQENFLKTKGFANENAIQVREFVEPGGYKVVIRAVDRSRDVERFFGECDNTFVGI